MVTYSINLSQPTEATTYNIVGLTAIDLSTVLDVLYDNTNKEITPSDIRNSILTLYSNSVFKQTYATGSNYEYVGIDTGNPVDPDLENKIFIGKRAYSGTYSYNPSYDIMSSALLNSDVDIFFYNTKRDTLPNDKTRVSILASTNSSLWNSAPYIESQIITSTSSLSFDIVNPSSGNIKISAGTFSTSAGTVSVNSIIFPSVAQSTGLIAGLTAAANDRLLIWDNGYLIWNNIVLPPLSIVGATGTPINIYGSPVYLNGFPLELTDSRLTPLDIGDVPSGTTFNMVEMVEVLRRIVYDYLPPICSVELLPPYASGYVEVGSSPLVKLKYTITKRTYPTFITGLTNMVPTSYPPISGSGQITISGTANGVVISPVSNSTTTFTATVTDGTQSNTATETLTGIYPYFYGFSNLGVMNTSGLGTLTKLIEPLGDKIIDITGSGNLYFIYDSSYPDLNLVLDDSNNVIGGSSSVYSLITMSSPTGLWASKQFKVYQWNGIPQVGPPSVNYQFKY